MAKKVNGKQKGNTFERDIANRLSARFATITGVEKAFRRNADSGSFFGGKNQQRIEQYDTDYALFGDLICPRNFMFSVECKNYKTPPTFNALIKQDIAEWDKWIVQAEQDAKNSNKKMMLIIKYNRTLPFVILGEKTSASLAGVYKNYFIYSLDDILLLPDEFFFS